MENKPYIGVFHLLRMPLFWNWQSRACLNYDKKGLLLGGLCSKLHLVATCHNGWRIDIEYIMKERRRRASNWMRGGTDTISCSHCGTTLPLQGEKTRCFLEILQQVEW